MHYPNTSSVQNSTTISTSHLGIPNGPIESTVASNLGNNSNSPVEMSNGVSESMVTSNVENSMNISNTQVEMSKGGVDSNTRNSINGSTTHVEPRNNVKRTSAAKNPKTKGYVAWNTRHSNVTIVLQHCSNRKRKAPQDGNSKKRQKKSAPRKSTGRKPGTKVTKTSETSMFQFGILLPVAKLVKQACHTLPLE